MIQELRFAQKGIVVDKINKRILVLRYSGAKYQSDKLKNKLGLPGGRIEFGEELDNSLVREVKEETGVDIVPLDPIYMWTWQYTKEDKECQIVAVARVANFLRGDDLINIDPSQEESDISEIFWLDIDKINLDEFVFDEAPAIKRFLDLKDIYL